MSRLSDTVLLEDTLKRLRLPAMLRDYPDVCARPEKRVKAMKAFFWIW